MNFKEAAEEDMEVFFNPEEFADYHNIDGVDMLIVIDEDRLEELKNTKDTYINGIHEAKLLFHVKKSDFGGKPATNTVLDVDNRTYRVINSAEDSGIITLILGWYND